MIAVEQFVERSVERAAERDSGVVTMFDHAPEYFLEALALVAEAFRCREIGGYRREEFAAKCVAAAGSEEYGRLYLALLPGDG